MEMPMTMVFVFGALFGIGIFILGALAGKDYFK